MISHSDMVFTMVGLQYIGKPDYDGIKSFRNNTFFNQSLGLGQCLSDSALRQRLDRSFPILFVYSFAVPALFDVIYHSRHPDGPGFHEVHWSVINAIRDQQDPHRMLQLIQSSADRVIEDASACTSYIYDLGFLGEYRIYEILWQQRDVSGRLLISEIIPTEELPARGNQGAIRFSLEGKGTVSYSRNGP